MIKKLLLGTVALGVMSTAAFAADLPSRRAPPVFVPAAIPVFSWTGFYAGGQIGFAFGEDRGTAIAPAAALGLNGFAQPHGAIGGGHVGYNFSTQSLGLGGLGGGGLVLGVEADIDGTDYRDTVIGVAGTGARLKTDIQGSARGRLGFAVDRALFYATGGAAFARFQTTYAAAPAFFNSLTASRVGYTVGGGVEYAITTQWSLRGEYRYADFGSFNDALTAGGVVIRRRETQQRAQVGFSYKFDAPVAAPVVARY